jgi:hypothetical protein
MANKRAFDLRVVFGQAKLLRLVCDTAALRVISAPSPLG